MSLKSMLQEYFSASKVKADYQWRLAALSEDSLAIQEQMTQLVKDVEYFVYMTRCTSKVSMRIVRANGINQLAWQFHEIRGVRWANGRHSAMQVIMPLEAMDEAKKNLFHQAMAFDVDGTFMRGLRAHERARLSLNYQARTISYISNLVESQVKFRALTL